MKSQVYKDNTMGLTVNVNIGQLEHGKLLHNKVVFLTGATGGIGKTVARKCISQDARVILAGKNKAKLNDLQAELGDKSVAICFDICDYNCYDKVLKLAHTKFGDINCIVNNAGISLHEEDFMDVTENGWDIQFNVNLKGPYFFTQAWLRYYRMQKITDGRIIMMASDTSGMGSSIPYGLSKAALASLTHGLAKKLVTEGVRVNAIAPGTTMTPMTEDLTQGKICRETTQGKRTLFPEEIAEVCIFLLSDLSVCISGNIFGCSESNICFDNINREQETNP